MKRELKPFLVEVKRGSRRSSLGESLDAVEPMTEAVRQAERALFAGQARDTVPSKPRAVEPPGRILPSLIEPRGATIEAEPEPPPRRRGRKPGSKNKPKLDRAGIVGGGVPTTSPNHFSEDVLAMLAASAPRPKAVSAPVDPARPNGPGGSESPSAESGVRNRGRLRDRSSILARYVFETEPVPGERWKRPTRRAERRRKLVTA